MIRVLDCASTQPLTMCGKVRHTTDSIALDLHVWAQHLANEWFKTSQLHDEQLVVGYNSPTKEFVSVGYISDKGQFIGRHSLLTAKLPNAALAAR